MDENTKAIVASNLTVAFYASRKAGNPDFKQIVDTYRQMLAAAENSDGPGDSDFVGAMPETGWAR